MSVKSVGKKERIYSILEKIRANEPFTLITLAKEFGVNEKTIERDIEELKKDGRIRFVGSKRSGHYKLQEEWGRFWYSALPDGRQAWHMLVKLRRKA